MPEWLPKPTNGKREHLCTTSARPSVSEKRLSLTAQGNIHTEGGRIQQDFVAIMTESAATSCSITVDFREKGFDSSCTHPTVTTRLQDSSGRLPADNTNENLNKSSPRRRPGSSLLSFLDDSLRSPCGPPSGRSTRHALLSGLRRNDESGLVQSIPKPGLLPAK